MFSHFDRFSKKFFFINLFNINIYTYNWKQVVNNLYLLIQNAFRRKRESDLNISNDEFYRHKEIISNESLNNGRYIVVKKLAKKLVGQMYLVEDKYDFER